jgi:hypothetical protein
LLLNKCKEKIDRKLTVVALLTMSAIAGHVAKATTRVASLLATAVSSVTAETASIVAALRAIACDMTDLTAFVAFLAATGSTIVVIARTSLGTLARNMSSNTAAVARLLLGGYCTLAA